MNLIFDFWILFLVIFGLERPLKYNTIKLIKPIWINVSHWKFCVMSRTYVGYSIDKNYWSIFKHHNVHTNQFSLFIEWYSKKFDWIVHLTFHLQLPNKLFLSQYLWQIQINVFHPGGSNFILIWMDFTQFLLNLSVKYTMYLAWHKFIYFHYLLQVKTCCVTLGFNNMWYGR